MDLGASGGYYVAVSADKIVAHPTTVTGSIGVIMLNLSVEGLLQKIGVKDTSIKTGEHKDMGSPLKTMTEEERKIFQRRTGQHVRKVFIGHCREQKRFDARKNSSRLPMAGFIPPGRHWNMGLSTRLAIWMKLLHWQNKRQDSRRHGSSYITDRALTRTTYTHNSAIQVLVLLTFSILI